MSSLPPPPRNSTAAKNANTPASRRSLDRALTDPDAVLRDFTRRGGAPDPAVHRNIPVAPFVIVFSAFALIAGFFGFGGGTLFTTPIAPHLAHNQLPIQTITATEVPVADATSAPDAQQLGMITLPAMDDASLQATNGTLIHIDRQTAELLYRWGGATGALCQVRLSDGRMPWVPCWRLGLPDATPMPTPLPLPTNPPPPPAPSATPAPPCASAQGQNGQFTQCGWDAGLQATVNALAGPALEIAPPPTVCATSGNVQVCGIGAITTFQNQADSFNAQTAAAAPAPPAQTIR